MPDIWRKLIRLLIILIGLGILIYPSLSEYLNQKNASRAIQSYDNSVNQANEDKLNALMREAVAYNELLTSATGYQKPPVDADGHPLSLERYPRTLNIDGVGMMGYISIPKINSTARILHGTEEPVLQSAIGHLQSTSLPVGGPSTHAVLVGHRGLPTAELFTDLDRLAVGDVFYIKVLNRTLCYTVDQILTVLPDETEALAIQKNKDYVTLVTCTPYGVNSHRLLVRGVRTDYNETQAVPVYEDTDMESFWSRLPVQYRHALIGAGVIVVFLFFWVTIRIIIRLIKRRKEKS